MFVAEYDGERIEIQNYANPRCELKMGFIRCPSGNHRLFIRQGVVKIPHFAHFPKTRCNFEKMQGEPESPAHQALKLYVVKMFDNDDNISRVLLERQILNGKRIADVYVEYKSGNAMAVECQLSSITAGKVLERTEDYHQAGIDVYWIFRKQILTSAFVGAISGVLPNVGEVIVNEGIALKNRTIGSVFLFSCRDVQMEEEAERIGTDEMMEEELLAITELEKLLDKEAEDVKVPGIEV